MSEENTNNTGWDVMVEGSFGNFGGIWRARSAKDGSYDKVEPLKFEAEAKSIGIFFGKIISSGGKFDVIVDGEKIKTIDTDFTGGWGNYVESAEVIEFDECAKHTIELVPLNSENRSSVIISAIAITK